MDQSTKNLIGVLQAVALYGKRDGLPAKHARRLGRMAILCVKAESGGRMYANTGVPRSQRLPHDAMGQDHDSVGLFQQRVGWDGNGAGWGDVHSAMDIRRSTFSFLDHAKDRGVFAYTLPKNKVGYDGYHRIRDLADRVQNIQVSWYDGSVASRPWGANYRANSRWSIWFMARYWIPGTYKIRSSKNYLAS